MLEELKNGTKVVGAKQTRRALNEDRAIRVYFAADADPALWEPIVALCEEKGVPAAEVKSMKELGHACSISVSAAVATLVTE